MTTRVPGLIQSGRAAFTQSTGKSHSGNCSMPPPTCRHEPATAGMAVDGAGGLRAAGRAFDGDADANGGRLRGGELASELGDVGGLHAGDFLDVLEREFGGACFELGPVRCVYLST